MKTFGDYEEKVNIPNGGEVQFRCGICFETFTSAEERKIHHKQTKEKKFDYHAPVSVAGSCYQVDAKGYRVTFNGRRY